MHKVAPISLLCCGFSFGLRVGKWAGQQQYFDREMAISSDLGPFCANLGISREYLLEGNTNTCSLPKLPTAELLVNGLVYELGQFRFEHNIGWRVFEQWITVLCVIFTYSYI